MTFRTPPGLSSSHAYAGHRTVSPTRSLAHHLAPADPRSTPTRGRTAPCCHNIRLSMRGSACALALPRYGCTAALPGYELRRVGARPRARLSRDYILVPPVCGLQVSFAPYRESRGAS